MNTSRESREAQPAHVLVPQEDFGVICWCAVRYALGRRTYIVSSVCDILQSQLLDIPKRDRLLMIRDIEEHAQYGPEAYGHECDKSRWMELLDRLKAAEG